MGHSWFRRRYMTVYPIHPMGWLVIALFFAVCGAWIAVDAELISVGPFVRKWAALLPYVAILGGGAALIAKTEPR